MKGFKIENGVLIDYIGEKGVTEVTIPDGVTSIGEFAFFECDSLTSISIPDSVTSIGFGAFYGCTGLKSITIPGSVTIIEFGAFRYCTGLKGITIPDSVTRIRDDTFLGCTGLKGMTIPNSVKGIGEGAFWGCKNLKTKKANYKAFYFQSGKLICRNYKYYEYKEDEWSENIDDIAICKRGYHFCDNLFAVFNYYSGEINKDIAIYECEVGEKVETDGIKSVTNRIKPVKRLYRKDVIRILNGGE